MGQEITLKSRPVREDRRASEHERKRTRSNNRSANAAPRRLVVEPANRVQERVELETSKTTLSVRDARSLLNEMHSPSAPSEKLRSTIQQYVRGIRARSE
ncbi:hypothetical protein Hgul01_05282 [Herpetosiphon gulosus]|uniref:Uncharacterized protein n=1 Tax=Herpetosiphon gulosus TaxID=1973496 RepID=A0ABP9X7U0_9CHLR